jgi:hypothetical protein
VLKSQTLLTPLSALVKVVPAVAALLYRSVSPEIGISLAVIVICAKLVCANNNVRMESMYFFIS